MSLLLAFPNTDEKLIERFLSKAENALNEGKKFWPDREAFEEFLNNKIKKYGVHLLRDESILPGISRIEFSESIFKESEMSKTEILAGNVPEYFTSEKQSLQGLSDLEDNFKKLNMPSISPIRQDNKTANMENPVSTFLEPSLSDFHQENKDFFGFDNNTDKPDVGLGSPGSGVLISNKFGPSLVSTPVPESRVPNKKSNFYHGTVSKASGVRLARIALGLFTLLMIFVVIKMFLELSSGADILKSNSVRHVSGHHHHRLLG